MREIYEIFIPLKKMHSGNVQQNMDDVVVLAFSSPRSDLSQRRKWRCLQEMHTYSAPTTPPSWSSEIWWSGRWDRQHDGVVSMVESMHRLRLFAWWRKNGERRLQKPGSGSAGIRSHQTGGALVPFIVDFAWTKS
jgi:hypothetical protein